jgi:hypothetical protein
MKTTIIATIIGGIFGLAAAIISGIFLVMSSSPKGATPPIASSGSSSAQASSLPPGTANSPSYSNPSSPESTPPQAVPQPTPISGTPAIPVLKPIISQPGWTLAWHQKVSIGSEGIIFGISAPDTGDGSNYDLQYVPGNGNAWNCGRYVEDFDYWSHSYPPGPATINGVSENMMGCALGQAHVGDREFVTLSTVGFVNRIAYMQIAETGAGGVVADIWTWNKA